MGRPCHFALFELQPAFTVDLQQLAARYRELARAVHPDRFADAGEREQRLALRPARERNDAEQAQKVAPRRRHHLKAHQEHRVAMEATVQDPQFLLQQMELREELESLHETADLAGVAAFKQRLKAAQLHLEEQFAHCWQDAAQRDMAERLMRRMQFLDKLAREVRQLEERLDD